MHSYLDCKVNIRIIIKCVQIFYFTNNKETDSFPYIFRICMRKVSINYMEINNIHTTNWVWIIIHTHHMLLSNNVSSDLTSLTEYDTNLSTINTDKNTNWTYLSPEGALLSKVVWRYRNFHSQSSDTTWFALYKMISCRFLLKLWICLCRATVQNPNFRCFSQYQSKCCLYQGEFTLKFHFKTIHGCLITRRYCRLCWYSGSTWWQNH